MNRLDIFRRNLPLLLVAAVTAGLFIYPYLPTGEPTADRPAKTTQPAFVQGARVRRQPLRQTYTAPATLQGRLEVSVLAPATGLVLQLTAQLGDRVRRGQLLARLADPLTEAALVQAQAQLTRSTKEVERIQTLTDRRLATQTQLQMLLAGQAQDAAEVNRLTTLLALTRVRSPLTGVVTRQRVVAGTTVRTGDTLLVIADVSRLFALALVPVSVAATIRVGDSLRLQTLPTGAWLPARVQQVFPLVDPVSRQVMVSVDAGPLYPRFKPGYPVRMQLQTARRENALTLDRRTITDDPGQDTVRVWVVRRGRATRRVVQIGLVLENEVELRSGLAEGDTVLYQGTETLKEGTPVQLSLPQPPNSVRQ